MKKESAKDLASEDVVKRAAAGDSEAFTDLFNLLYQPVLNYIYRMVGERQTAEDITQDAFIRAHRRIGQLGPPWDFKSWVYRIASNLAVDYLRRERRYVNVEDIEMRGDRKATLRPPERRAQLEEKRRAVWKTLDSMPTSYRQALVLREFNQLSYKELTNALECSYDSVRQTVHRARGCFRERHGLRMMIADGAQRCQVLGDMLSAYCDGELTPEQRRAVKAHIASCAQCQQTERDMKKIGALLAVVPPIIPSAGWKESVLEKILSDQIYAPQTPTVHSPSAKQGENLAGDGGHQGGYGAGGASTAGKYGLATMMSKLLPLALITVAGALLVSGIVLGAKLWSSVGPNTSSDQSDSGILEPPALEPTSTMEMEAAAPGLANSSATKTMIASLSPTSTMTPSPTGTATLGPPIATAKEDANCRFGPGMAYDVVGYLLEDQSAPIDGRNADKTWWWIERQDGYGHCWIWDSLVELSGDISGVPIIAAPPTPTPDDTQAPTVRISYAPTGNWRPDTNDVITITARASDNNDVARIEIWLKAPGSGQFLRKKVCEGVNTCIYQGGPYASGKLMCYAQAWDAAGNQGESDKVEIDVHYIVE